MKSKSLHNALISTFATLLVAASAATVIVRTAHAGTSPHESAGEMLDDTVMTTKIKAAFVQDEKVSALRINVTSNKGIVQLSGFANSPQEVARAAEVARKVPGVKDVKNDILLK